MDINSYKNSNFSSGFFFLSKEQKEALSIVYAFCRYADDAVDEHYDNAPALLSHLRAELTMADSDFSIQLAEIIEKYDIPKEYFFDLIDGVESDLRKSVCFETFNNLEWYIYRVAGVVGLMCIHIFGFTNPQTKKYATTLAKAVQMTNILRDIYQDAQMGRLYLPLEDLEKFQVPVEDIFEANNTPEVKNLIAFERQRTAEFYVQAKALLPKQDFKSMLAARIMGNIYEAIFHKMKAGIIFKKKVKLSKLTKLSIVFKTWRNKL